MSSINGEIRSTVDKIWDTMWTGGSSNPIAILEQLTNLMFLHDLYAKDSSEVKANRALGLNYDSLFSGPFEYNGRSWDKKNFRWDTMQQMGSVDLFDTAANGAIPFLRSFGEQQEGFGSYLSDTRFDFPNELIFQQIFDLMSKLYDQLNADKNDDIRGDVYEYMLSKMSTSKVNGQFRTPRHIIRMMVELVQPKWDDKVCDPACGTAGFLAETAKYVMKNYSKEISSDDNIFNYFSNSMFTGYDKDHTMLRISAMNMMLHDAPRANIVYKDSLSSKNTDNEEYSLILANPPFKGSLVDKSLVSPDLLKVTNTTKTELLFLAAMMRMLRMGGRCAVIVPDGVLFGGSNAHVSVRRTLIEDHTLEAVISMPSGVFRPYSGVSTAILIFSKNGEDTENVWFYDMAADGYSLDDKRQEVEQNDIPDIISRFRNLDNERENTRDMKSFFVPKDEIVKNDYDLSINRYKKVQYEEVKYPPSKEIVKEMIEFNNQLSVELQKLNDMLQ